MGGGARGSAMGAGGAVRGSMVGVGSVVACVLLVVLAAGGCGAARQPVAVGVELFYLDLRLIDSRNVLFEVNVESRYTWRNDSITSESSLDNIWLPTIQHTNLKKREYGYPDVLLAGDGFVQLRTREVSKYSFAFKFSSFPFDEQEPHIVLEAVYQTGDHYVQLYSAQDDDIDSMISHKDEFTVEGWRDFRNPNVIVMPKVNGVGDETNVLVIGFEAARVYNSFLVQQVVPAIIFVMYSWAGFFIDITSVMPRLMPILIAVVNLANFNASLGVIIPRSSDTTWMEVFALVSVLFAALVAVELLIVHNFARHGKRELAKGTDFLARVIFPGLYIALFFFFIIDMAAEEPLWAAFIWLVPWLLIVLVAAILTVLYRVLHVMRKHKDEPE